MIGGHGSRRVFLLGGNVLRRPSETVHLSVETWSIANGNAYWCVINNVLILISSGTFWAFRFQTRFVVRNSVQSSPGRRGKNDSKRLLWALTIHFFFLSFLTTPTSLEHSRTTECPATCFFLFNLLQKKTKTGRYKCTRGCGGVFDVNLTTRRPYCTRRECILLYSDRCGAGQPPRPIREQYSTHDNVRVRHKNITYVCVCVCVWNSESPNVFDERKNTGYVSYFSHLYLLK